MSKILTSTPQPSPITWMHRVLNTLWLAASFLLMAHPSYAANLPDFSELVENNAPAVVNISTVQKKSKGKALNDYSEQIPEIFKHFFGEGFGDGFGGDLQERFSQPPRQKESLGSGFIISKDGYVLTNYHVVRNADEVMVRLSDRRELVAELIGADERSDLALLKLQGDDFPVVTMGRSEPLKVGEWVVAIGSPFGFEHSVTQGIVSAKGRSLPNENYVPFIQTDVAINPGNSGGPLFNLDGEVIGINSQIYSRTGGFMGVSFAIPVDVAMEVVEQLKSGGQVSRGGLGVMIQEVNRDLAESFGLDKPAGALVAEVVPDSPAEAAGLQQGDVIVAFDGQTINGQTINLASDLPHMVGRKRVGDRVKVQVYRGGKKYRKKLVIAQLPDEPSHTKVQKTEPKAQSSNRLGLVVKPLTTKQKQTLDSEHGVQVVSVEGDSAKEAGLRSGDIITMLNNRAIDDAEGLKAALKSLNTEAWVPILVHRGGKPMFIAVQVPE